MGLARVGTWLVSQRRLCSPPPPSRTLGNLRQAFRVLSVNAQRHESFARQAFNDGPPYIGGAFQNFAGAHSRLAVYTLVKLSQAHDPTTHAGQHPLEALEAAQDDARLLAHTLLPRFAREARRDGLAAVAAWFDRLGDAQRRRLDILQSIEAKWEGRAGSW